MFSDYTRLEQFVFLDKRPYYEYAVQDIETEIALLEEGVANLRRYVSEGKAIIRDLGQWNGQVTKYREHVLIDFTDKLKNYEQLKSKNESLLRKLIDKRDKISNAHKSDVADDTTVLLLKYLDQEIKSLDERIKDIVANIKSYEKDKANYAKLTDEALLQALTNILYFNKKYVEGHEYSIESNKKQIKTLQTVRDIFLNQMIAK